MLFIIDILNHYLFKSNRLKKYFQRNNISYVEQTLSSIFENTNNSSYIKVVVYIGESDEKFINKKMNDLSNKFSKELEENLLQVKVT